MHGGWDYKGAMVAPIASTHPMLIQYHGMPRFMHPRMSNINHTTSTPKGVTMAPFFLTVYPCIWLFLCTIHDSYIKIIVIELHTIIMKTT